YDTQIRAKSLILSGQESRCFFVMITPHHFTPHARCAVAVPEAFLFPAHETSCSLGKDDHSKWSRRMGEMGGIAAPMLALG
ncbi:MAG: hypothetical protein OEM81_05580, partial [Acidimicrobiia bacterium]|nr:hypothetical protein [Acidimicrobiia bacterium]MDH5615638.1 hypothetical protein [Acidimicrobiia bacterium]